MPPMLYVLFFLAAFLAIEGIFFLVQTRRRATRTVARQRLRRMGGGLGAPELGAEGSILRRPARNWLVGGLPAFPGWEALELQLYRAGLSISPPRFLVACVALGLGGWLGGAIMLSDWVRSLPLLGLSLLPWFQVARMRNKRTQQFERQFPEALDLLTRALRAGNSLAFGFQMVGEELPDPVGAEFSQVAEEIKLGQDTRRALANLAYRVDSADLPFFITAILIQRETGGNLAEILDKLGHVIRERLTLYGKVRALTAIGRASANLLALWPLAMVGLMYTCGGEGGREYVAPLWETRQGHMLAVVGAVMVIVGYVLCRRMATIRV